MPSIIIPFAILPSLRSVKSSIDPIKSGLDGEIIRLALELKITGNDLLFLDIKLLKNEIMLPLTKIYYT